jgi:hypothetical protein
MFLCPKVCNHYPAQCHREEGFRPTKDLCLFAQKCKGRDLRRAPCLRFIVLANGAGRFHAAALEISSKNRTDTDRFGPASPPVLYRHERRGIPLRTFASDGYPLRRLLVGSKAEIVLVFHGSFSFALIWCPPHHARSAVHDDFIESPSSTVHIRLLCQLLTFTPKLNKLMADCR